MGIPTRYGLSRGWPIVPGTYAPPYTPPGPIPARAILYADGTPLRWADNTISEWAV